MRRNRDVSFGLALFVLVWGCHRAPDLVFVRLSEAPLEPLSTVDAPPSPPAGANGGEATIPRLEGRQFYFGEAQERRARAIRILEENSNLAVQQFIAGLTDDFEEAIAAFEREQRARLAPEHRAAMDSAYERARVIFERYARQIAPLRYRLTLLQGFPERADAPDPDPEQFPIVLRAEEAREAKRQIAALDAAYRIDVGNLIREAQTRVDDDLATLQEELIDRRDRFLRELDKFAERQAREQYGLLGEAPAIEENVRFAMVPGVRTRLETRSAPPPAPRPDPIPDERRRWLRHDLEVWLRTRGFRLAPVLGPGVRDATEEFLEWRAEHRNGR